MAKVVGATADQLREAGRNDAATELEALISQRDSQLGSGLASLVPSRQSGQPTESKIERPELEQELSDENRVLESTWSAASELTDAVLESDPSDRLRAAAQRVVFLLSGQVIIRILRSGHAPYFESWLERVYRERDVLHKRLGDTPTPWVQDVFSNPKEAAHNAIHRPPGRGQSTEKSHELENQAPADESSESDKGEAIVDPEQIDKGGQNRGLHSETNSRSDRDLAGTDTTGNNPETGSNTTGSGDQVPSDAAAAEMSDAELQRAAQTDPLWADYVKTKRPELILDF
ncbi:hypothetical protein [Mycolicibacterium fortuitum]|uniref:hypothetical protein n=1 Tax=Mycolicibacterium fortuitum TaxID=1766 RepID=UPI0029538571|nr:hypothetical protein [Mycolicibacterium fortuitum]MDV7195813.1 hypothetical protein [Mycolicibacterium fortuitum]MDV7302860.1 hypothetical protein [Mycolicibacterium fortuitum]